MAQQFNILHKVKLPGANKKVDIRAPEVAARYKPGQYLIIIPDPQSQRIAFTNIDVDAKRGIVSVVFKEDNPTCQRLGSMKIGDELYALQGPMGRAIDVDSKPCVCVMSEGNEVVGSIPVCRLFTEQKTKVIALSYFKSRANVFYEAQLRLHCFHQTVHILSSKNTKYEVIAQHLDQQFKRYEYTAIVAAGSLDFIIAVKQWADSHAVELKVNLTFIINELAPVFDWTGIQLAKQNHCLALDGVFCDSIQIGEMQLRRVLQSLKEFSACQKQLSSASQSRKESGIFPKFFSGLRSVKQ